MKIATARKTAITTGTFYVPTHLSKCHKIEFQEVILIRLMKWKSCRIKRFWLHRVQLNTGNNSKEVKIMASEQQVHSLI